MPLLGSIRASKQDPELQQEHICAAQLIKKQLVSAHEIDSIGKGEQELIDVKNEA